MIKIKYGDPTDQKKMELEYLKLILSEIKGKKFIKNQLRAALPSMPAFNLNKLITGSFSELLTASSFLSDHFVGLSDKEKGEWENYIDYELLQPKISSFFEQQKNMNLKTCYYCNIDFINAFEDDGKYKSVFEFLMFAGKDKFLEIHGIGNSTWEVVSKARKSVVLPATRQDFGIGKGKFNILVNNYQSVAIVRNHFTLDHVIPKGKYPFFALSLYNFVPSCSSCNSKFKNQREFDLEDALNNTVPSSNGFDLDKCLEFKILYTVDPKHCLKVSKYDLELRIIDSDVNRIRAIHQYLELFKLKGRYSYHKNKAIELVEKRLKYSEKEIEILSKKMSVSINEVRRLIFGNELFDEDKSEEPIVKMLRDVAHNADIPNVYGKH